MNRKSSGRIGNDRRGTGNNWDGIGNNRDGTVAPRGPYRPRQCYGNASMNAVRVPAFTGAPPGHYRRPG
ncbi:hypothetical protein DPMN_046160 [Dreissena polymorpha]|uniref:Uncharacterized protein n=1 Tax=Dreissena polymorpha TaxID=45954 RepID=A0A9D4I0C8_DREPO|nr:hypothetical protein DPMN_046160 [Dreissena polymorpha]